MKNFIYLASYIFLFNSFLFCSEPQKLIYEELNRQNHYIKTEIEKISYVVKSLICQSRMLNDKIIELKAKITLDKKDVDISAFLYKVAKLPLVKKVTFLENEINDQTINLNVKIELFRNTIENNVTDILYKKPRYAFLFGAGLVKLLKSKTVPSFIFSSLKQALLSKNMLSNNNDTAWTGFVGYLSLLLVDMPNITFANEKYKQQDGIFIRRIALTANY